MVGAKKILKSSKRGAQQLLKFWDWGGLKDKDKLFFSAGGGGWGK